MAEAAKEAGLAAAAPALIPTVFVALCLYFLLEPGAVEPLEAASQPVDPAVLAPVPWRSTLGDPPTLSVAGLRLRCSECHRLFQSPPGRQALRQQHLDVVLDHGLNDDCYNCHSPSNRNALLLQTGEELHFADSVLLCRQCHGPTWRDWRAGMHGKTLGFWDPSLGPARHLRCTECHDPHQPRFPALAPLPGPRTRRMTVRPSRESAVADHGVANPLQTWRRLGGADEP